MAIKTVNEQVTTTLTVQFTNDGVTTKVNADQTPVLRVYKGSTLVTTIQGTNITNTTTGVYSGVWTPTVTGEYEARWTFIVSTISYSQTEAVFVLDSDGGGLTPDDPLPDIGTSNLCLITGTFIDVSGNYKKGVHVRFSPTLVSEYNTSDGFIIDDITTESNANGQVSFYLRQGIKGLLTIAGTGIVRQVTIPAESTKDIFDLVSEADDLLEVQNPDFYEIIKRS